MATQPGAVKYSWWGKEPFNRESYPVKCFAIHPAPARFTIIPYTWKFSRYVIFAVFVDDQQQKFSP